MEQRQPQQIGGLCTGLSKSPILGARNTNPFPDKIGGWGPGSQWKGQHDCGIDGFLGTLCYAIALPGQKSGFRARFRLDSNPENIKIVPQDHF